MLIIRRKTALDMSYPNESTACLEYTLSQSYHLRGPHVAKVLCVKGSKLSQIPVFVSVPFVQPQDVFGESLPVVGCSINDANSWVPITESTIPAVGTLTITPVKDPKVQKFDKLVVWIKIVPTHSVTLT